MKIIKIDNQPSSNLFELNVKNNKLILNNLEFFIPIETIFIGHNLEGKFIKGYDKNQVSLFRIHITPNVEFIKLDISHTDNIYEYKFLW